MAALSSWLKHLIQFLNGFRKFSIMVLLIVVGVIFRVTDFISGAEFVDLLKATTVAFMATNGIEHMSKSVIEWVKGKVSNDSK